MAKEYYKKTLDIVEENGWDNKEWARHAGISQRVLETLISRNFPEDEQARNALFDFTSTGEGVDTSFMLRFKSPIVIASCVHKGGCGKTTAAVAIADELADRDYNVLFIDTDSQMDATSTLLMQEKSADAQSKNIFAALTAGDDIRKYILPTAYDNLELVPSSTKMVSAEAMLMTQAASGINADMAFRDIMKGLIQENFYDFVVIDMDKNAGYLNRTIFNGCTHLLMTCETSLYNMTGAAVMQSQYSDIKEKTNPDLDLLGVILNKVSKRKTIYTASVAEFDNLMPGKRFETCIPVDANVEKAQWEWKTLRAYSRRSEALKCFSRVTDEILERLKPLSIQ